MAEPGTEGQAPSTPQEPGTQAVPPTTPAPGSQVPPAAPVQDPNPQGDEWDKERAKKTIESLRTKEKDWDKDRKELENLRKQVQEAENAKLTEDEKLKKRLVELEASQQQWQSERKQLLLTQAIDRAIAATDAKYPDLVALRIQGSELELDDEGRPTESSLKAQLKEIKEKYPDLFGKGATPPGVPPAPPSGTPTNPAKGSPLTPESVAAMSTDEINARWDEIQAALRSGQLKRVG